MTPTLPEVVGRYVTVDGTRTYIDQCGDTGPTILCIHTAGACSLQCFDFIQAMAQRGFRALAIDLPGHGKSYPIDWQPVRHSHEYAEFVWKVIKTICPVEKAIVCGSAVGAAIALDLACHHSDDLLALVSLEGLPVAEGDQFTRYCEWWEHPHSAPGWRDMIERVGMSGLHGMPPESVEELRWLHRYCAQEVGTGDLQCWVNHDVREKLKNISCPTLAFKGQADYWIPEDALDFIVSEVPGGLAEKAIGPGMGHFPMFERPEALADILVDFFRRRGIA
jgi:pimeloyl-ACP methyl ester carboxylesterase